MRKQGNEEEYIRSCFMICAPQLIKTRRARLAGHVAIDLAEDRNRWWTLVNEVMNL
jgi:hypothetical protein